MKFPQLSKQAYIIVALAIVLAMSTALFLMGREPMCTCGTIKFWHGVVKSSENSQQLFDWYTFTHVVHGLGFYLLLTLLNKRMPFGVKLLAAIFLESAWEILENTDMIINRYRAATISLDYYGDSIVNSVGDVIAMIAGFVIAAKKPIWMSIALFLILEIALAVIIRDNLTINIIMLIHPMEAIKHWQNM